MYMFLPSSVSVVCVPVATYLSSLFSVFCMSFFNYLSCVICLPFVIFLMPSLIYPSVFLSWPKFPRLLSCCRLSLPPSLSLSVSLYLLVCLSFVVCPSVVCLSPFILHNLPSPICLSTTAVCVFSVVFRCLFF